MEIVAIMFLFMIPVAFILGYKLGEKSGYLRGRQKHVSDTTEQIIKSIKL